MTKLVILLFGLLMSLRVAHTYDRNRSHPPEVSGRIATAITEPVERVFREPHILEVGVGTGRIGMPLVARGYRFTGIDTDPEMMEVFKSKFAGVSRKVMLLEADVQDLPFTDMEFHAVVAVHIWHLVPKLEQALDETLRVIRPGGFLFEGWDEPTKHSPILDIQQQWQEALAKHGHKIKRGKHKLALENVAKSLKKRKLVSTESVVAKWELDSTPEEVLESLVEGLYSFAKPVPMELRVQAARDIRPGLEAKYKDMEAPLKSHWAFHLRSTRLPQEVR